MENVRNQRYQICGNQSKKETFGIRTKLSKFFEYLLAVEMEKIQIFMSKPVYLDLSIFEISKIVIYEF